MLFDRGGAPSEVYNIGGDVTLRDVIFIAKLSIQDVDPDYISRRAPPPWICVRITMEGALSVVFSVVATRETVRALGHFRLRWLMLSHV